MIDVTTPLRAEEDNFSLDDGYLMNKSSMDEEEEGAVANLPLR